MKLRAGKSELVIGGNPQVNLFPKEVQLQRNSKVIRPRLVIAVISLILLVFLGSGLARIQGKSIERKLMNAQSTSRNLLAAQAHYVEVRIIQNEVGTILAAQQVGTATEIDWKKYLNSVQETLPERVTLESVTIDSATPFSIYTQATVPLQGARIATLSFTANSPSLPKVPAWLDALTALPGYADASPGMVVRNDSGTYSVSITMHINQSAFTHRFFNKVGK